MDLLNHYVNEYLKLREKDESQLRDIRVTRQPIGLDALWWEVEVDFFNGHVTYTEVFRLQLDDGKVQFRTITSRTRLHVPAREVPNGAIVFTTKGEGPWVKVGVLETDESRGQLFLFLAASEYGTILTSYQKMFVDPKWTVSVPFYFARGEGAIAGGMLFASQDELEKWIAYYKPLGGLNALVGGCKFELWAAACAASSRYNCRSTFDLPKANGK